MENNKELKKIEFKSMIEIQEKRGYKILSFGNFASGKTYFGLTFPEPIYIIDTENGASPLQKEFPNKNIKIINICDVEGDRGTEIDEVNNLQKYFDIIDYLINLPNEQVGTIIIDSLTDIWDWCQAYAKTKIFKIPIENRFNQQFDWGVPNSLFRRQLLRLINKNCNVLFTARETERYASAGQSLGIYDPKIQKKTPYFVDVVLYHKQIYSKEEIIFESTIQKCRYNGSMIGKKIQNITYDKFTKLLEK